MASIILRGPSCHSCHAFSQQRSAKSFTSTVFKRHSRTQRFLNVQAVLTRIPHSRDPVGSPRRLPVMGLISALVDVQAQVQQFEVFAGRTAMIGFIIALSAELLTERSIFRTVNLEQVALYGSAVAAAVLLAAAAAAAAGRRQLGLDIKEAVITSMTAAQRSAASVTGNQVDRAVDSVVNKVFNMGVIYSLLADEDLI